ncbi:MAG TPA: universal stress protein [Nitrospira sp.]|nr:universal stress protein [Nitrospira sp.]
MSVPTGGLRILFATDGSQGSAVAEAYAYVLARSWGVSLTVMRVLEFPTGLDPENPVNRLYLAELMKEATQELVELKARAVARGISVETRITTGIPSEEVLMAAMGEESDLIVVGTRGRTGLAHVLLGSTAERITRAAPCPVLAVRAELQEEEKKGGHRHNLSAIERILVPIDFSDCSLDALEYGALVAQRSEASIRMLHVLEPVSYGLDFTLPHVAKRDHDRTAVTKRLSDLATALTSAGLVSDFVVSGGLPADSILNAAVVHDASLIVMGTHGRRGLAHALFGSVAEFVLQKSSCPVLTVRSPRFHPDHRRVLVRPSMPSNM